MPESVEDYYARILAATDTGTIGGRLRVAVEEMPGWDIFPYELDSLRLKPIQPLRDAEPDRHGEDPTVCWCASRETTGRTFWSDDNWLLVGIESGLPVILILQPRAHHDLGDLTDGLAAECGRLTTAISAAVEALPSVGRTHLARWGDGGAHLHLWFLGRPARVGQFRGSPLIDWEENLPRVPQDVADANAYAVAARVTAAYGGTAHIPAWEPDADR
jgi:diadenosine tetraphosphate (Ap4A) HIT family hydrolase